MNIHESAKLRLLDKATRIVVERESPLSNDLNPLMHNAIRGFDITILRCLAFYFLHGAL